jgi:hypothetical protein
MFFDSFGAFSVPFMINLIIENFSREKVLDIVVPSFYLLTLGMGCPKGRKRPQAPHPAGGLPLKRS